MSDGESREVSGSDIDSVAQKLQQLYQALSPNEQMVMDWLMARAAQSPTPDEVQGYASMPGLQPGSSIIHFSNALGLSSTANPMTQYASKYAFKIDFRAH